MKKQLPIAPTTTKGITKDARGNQSEQKPRKSPFACFLCCSNSKKDPKQGVRAVPPTASPVPSPHESRI